MGINVNEIYKRADIKQFREFLISGGTLDENCYGTYQERLDRDTKDIKYALTRLSKNHASEKLEDAIEDLLLALATYQDVFTEIGMKVGARLMFQFLCDD